MIPMEFISILLIALGLSADCFAVALSAGLSNIFLSFKKQLRISFSFGLFQAVMAYIGWVAGRTIVDIIAEFDHWIAFSLLLLVGGKMIRESLRHNQDDHEQADISRLLPLLILSFATSIDALAVGLSLAFVEVKILWTTITIGLVAFIMSIFGLLAGKQASRIIGRRAELFGGIILIVIGLKILIEHLF
jgi:putative Mn2+ efflux pump MntP